MEDLVSKLLSFPPSSPVSDTEYDKFAKQIVKKLDDIPTKQLASSGPDGQDLLDLINPAENSIAYLLILNAHVEARAPKAAAQSLHRDLLVGGALWPKFVDFFETFDPVQVRYVSGTFRQLLELVTQAAEQSSQPFIAVPILRDVILRLDPSSSTLTSTHLYFVYLCLRLRLYRDALPILERGIYNIPPSQEKRAGKSILLCSQEAGAGFLIASTGLSGKISTREYLQYFLYGAMIHIALRQWEKAVVLLETVLMVPSSHTASMIMVEAYKKYALIGLLIKGKPLNAPKAANSQALKHIRAMARPYDAVAESFATRDPQRLQGDIDVGHRENIWQKDNNLGLIYEVMNAFRKFSVRRLGETFAALPIAEVARRTSPDPTNLPETQNYISNLIISGELSAIISQNSTDSSPTLRFLTSSSTTKSEKQLQLGIENQKAKLAVLLELIMNDDHRLEISKEYLEYLQRLKKGKEDEEKAEKASQAAAAKGKTETRATQDDFDEDMMAEA